MNPELMSLTKLRSIPAFKDYAVQEMAQDTDFWNHQAQHGTGIMRYLAKAIIEVGGGSI